MYTLTCNLDTDLDYFLPMQTDQFISCSDGFDFILIAPNSNWWVDIIFLGRKCDYEFVPPLSHRMPIDEYFARFRNEKGFTLIATKGNELVGCLCSFYKHPETNKPYYQCLMIEDKYRGHKLARKFYEICDEHLRDRAEHFVQLRTWSQNTKNIRAVKSVGFFQIDVLIDARGNGTHTLLFEKYLFKSSHFNHIKKLGVLGGVGSLASSNFVLNLCKLDIQKGSEQKQIPFILNSAPDTPDRTEKILAGKNEELTTKLTLELQEMVAQQVSHIVICCFTYHAVLNSIPEFLRKHVVSLIDYTNILVEKKKGNYLLLASLGTYETNLFKNTKGIFYPSPEDQENIHRCIYRIKVGEPNILVFRDLTTIIKKYEFTGLVLGCTELYLLSKEFEENLKENCLINPLKTICYDIVNNWKESLL